MILLNGNTLALVSQASAMARALQPAVVVLEDCDLFAEDRSFGRGPQPLLFEVLDPMDRLEPDSDVAFLFTTIQVGTLERALVQPPGRIELAVQNPRPDVSARKDLLRLYDSKLNLSVETIDSVAKSIEGTTASFTREVIRRAVLATAIAVVTVADQHLRAVAAELMDESQSLTRSFLGGTEDPELEDSEGTETYGEFGWAPGVETTEFGFVDPGSGGHTV